MTRRKLIIFSLFGIIWLITILNQIHCEVDLTGPDKFNLEPVVDHADNETKANIDHGQDLQQRLDKAIMSGASAKEIEMLEAAVVSLCGCVGCCPLSKLTIWVTETSTSTQVCSFTTYSSRTITNLQFITETISTHITRTSVIRLTKSETFISSVTIPVTSVTTTFVTRFFDTFTTTLIPGVFTESVTTFTTSTSTRTRLIRLTPTATILVTTSGTVTSAITTATILSTSTIFTTTIVTNIGTAITRSTTIIFTSTISTSIPSVLTTTTTTNLIIQIAAFTTSTIFFVFPVQTVLPTTFFTTTDQISIFTPVLQLVTLTDAFTSVESIITTLTYSRLHPDAP